MEMTRRPIRPVYCSCQLPAAPLARSAFPLGVPEASFPAE